MMKRSLLVFAILLGLCGPSPATVWAVATAPPKELVSIDAAGAVALTGATAIDGTGASPLPAAVVVVADGRISYAGNADGVRLGPHVEVVNLAGRWIVPGFIDAHGHVPPPDGVPGFLTQLLAFGTTTLRAPFGPRAELRDLVASGAQLGPRLFVSGNLIDGTESFSGVADRVATEAEVRDVVRRQVGRKVDFIKLYDELPPDLVRAAIDEAHRHGLRVMGHLGRTTWTQAAEMGIDSLSHSWYAGLAHSIVPAEHQGELKNFYIPNRRFDPGLFRKWREIVDPNGPEVERLAAPLREHHVEVHPNLVLGEAVTWGDDPAVLERLEPDFAPVEVAATWRRGGQARGPAPAAVAR
jgi:hypothetical protein